MFSNVALIPFCLLVAAYGTADVAGPVSLTLEDQPNAGPLGIGALRNLLATLELKDPARLFHVIVSTLFPDLLALVAAALFFYFLNSVLVVPKKWSKPRSERAEESDVEPDSQVPEISGCTPLHLAAHNGSAREIGALINAGLDVNALDNYNETALHMAARMGRTDICTILLDAGVDPNVQNKNLKTAFLVAAIGGHAEVCELLRPGKVTRRMVAPKEKAAPQKLPADEDVLSDDSTDITDGSPPNEECNFGSSELHDAALRSSLRQVTKLLHKGAEVDRRDPWGETALHMAARVGCLEVCATLCAARANPSLRNKDSNSALDVASFSQHKDICRLLQDFS